MQNGCISVIVQINGCISVIVLLLFIYGMYFTRSSIVYLRYVIHPLYGCIHIIFLGRKNKLPNGTESREIVLWKIGAFRIFTVFCYLFTVCH